MASPPYNSRRGCQTGHINQDGWGYPWTPVNNTLPVYPNANQSVSPSLRRAVPAQVPSTPIRPSVQPMLQSPTYGTAPTPWGIDATPIACPESAITPQNVAWVDWSHSSQCNPPSEGHLQPVLSFNSVGVLSNTGADDRTPTGGEDGHVCGNTSHVEYV